MEVKQSKMSQIITKVFTRTTLSLCMLALGLVIVVILSIAQFMFDFEHFDFASWISNSLLLTGILIIFMVIGESFINTIKERPTGMYQFALKGYRNERAAVDNLTVYFGDYHTDYREKELKNKKIRILINNGIGQAREIVENLRLKQIELLVDQPMEVNGIEFLTITKSQRDVILDTLKNTRIGFTSINYYLSEFRNYGETSDQDLAEIINKKRKAYRWGGRIVRIVLGLSISFLFAAVTAQDFMNAGDYQSWYNLFSRIFTAFSGLATGYTIAYGINSFDIEELVNKKDFLHNFKLAFDSKIWVPMDRHEKFLKQKEEYEEKKKAMEVEQEIVEKVEPLKIEEKKVIKL